MSAERFSLDTNVLVYAVDARDRSKHALALSIVAAAARLDCPLGLQAIGEFYVAATSRVKLMPADAAGRARQLMTGFETFTHTPSAMRAALAESAAGRFSLWDGVLLASAAQAGCTAILSEDMADGARFGSIVVVNPFAAEGLSVTAKNLLRM